MEIRDVIFCLLDWQHTRARSQPVRRQPARRLASLRHQDHDGDGDHTESEGFNHIASETAMLVIRNDISSAFQTEIGYGRSTDTPA